MGGPKRTSEAPAAPPPQVLRAYGLNGARIERIERGLINLTFRVARADLDQALVIQRLHPVFGAEVHLDIEAITNHLAARGLLTPRLVHTVDDHLWVETERGEVWRALTYIDGRSVDRVESAEQAREGFGLIARFHRALADLDHPFHFARAGVHDTAAHLRRLREVGSDALSRDILAAAAGLPPLGNLPARIAHGDLKISNLLFEHGPHGRALCLIDLDTLGRQTMAYELGDALRSWCNPSGEDVEAPAIDAELFRAAIEGYAARAGDLLSPAECASLVPGLETVCLELAARFCVDAFEDRYFGWDASRFPDRPSHNRVRARGQLALARSVRTRRAQFAEIAERAFAR